MKMLLAFAFLILSTLPLRAQDDALAKAPELVLLHLADGATLWGEIVAHDAAALSFRRLDTGGEVKVPWTRLDTVQSDAMREEFGYIDHSDEELTIEADRLVLDDGTEVKGKIVNRTDTTIVVKTASLIVQVPKLRIRGSAGTMQVPASLVYTREELYQQERANLVVDSASSQYDLARFCERIRDHAHALEHFQKAAEIDPNFKNGELKSDIARAKTQTENQAQIDYLYRIEVLTARKKFDEAAKLVDGFAALYPSSTMTGELEKAKKSIEKARAKELRDLVVSLWNFHVGRLIEKEVRDPKVSLGAATQYATEKLSEDVLNAVTSDLQRRVSKTLEAEQVRKLWNERKNPPAQKATYGIGTWMLGDDARKGLDQQKGDNTGPASAPSEKDAERAKLEEKIKRYFQNQAMVKKAKQDEDKEGDAQAFWSTWVASGKRQWLLAYYVEHGKDYQGVKPLFTNCPDCGGTGVREVLNTGSAVSSPKSKGGRAGKGGQAQNTSGLVLVDCPTCRHQGIRRRVLFH